MEHKLLQPFLAAIAAGLLLAVLSMSGSANPAALADWSQDNLLVNPDFEEGFSIWQGTSEVTVADGWVPWWVQGTEEQVREGYFKRPEFKPELERELRPDGTVRRFGVWFFHGDKAQHYFNSFGTHDAGLYQQVPVPPGSYLEFSAWVRVHSSDCDDPCVSPLEPCNERGNSHGAYRIAVGIDPQGAVPTSLGAPPPDTVIWSDLTVPPYDTWVQVRVFAQAEADTVTVYLRGWPEWPVKHNDAYWDSAALHVLPGTPTPTNTLPPSSTPTITLTPTQTGTPTQTPTMTPTLPRDKLRYLPLVNRDWAPPTPAWTPTMTPSATGTFTPTPTATDTCTPTPTPTGSPACVEGVTNGDFEADEGWQFGPTLRPPGYVIDPAGGQSRVLRLGIPNPAEDLETWSYAWQTVSLPPGASEVALTFRYYGISRGVSGDWAEALIRDATGVPLKLILWLPSPALGTQRWETVNMLLPPDLLSRLADDSLQLYFNVYNDGDGAPAALYLDDVSLLACPARARAPVPPGSDIRIVYPIRHHPGQENFWLPDTCRELEFESVLIQNVGTTAPNMGGWTLSDREGNVFTFPELVLEPGAKVRVWTQAGENVPTDLYWGRSEPVWNNDSDEAVLRDDLGTEVARLGYP
jgi:hypothetical protein